MVVLIGGKGSGKGTVIDPLLQIMGDAGGMFSSLEHIFGRFNAGAAGKLLTVLNEIDDRGEGKHVEQMKNDITENCIQIEAKGIDPTPVKNYNNYFMLSNHSAPIV